MLYKQRKEEERLSVGKQDVGVPRDNSLVLAVPIETKHSVDAVQTEERRRVTPSRQQDVGVPRLVVAVPIEPKNTVDAV